MKKVVLKLAGAGKTKLLNSIRLINGYEVMAFTDSNIAIKDDIAGIKVISVYDVVDMYMAGDVDAVVIDSGVRCELIKKMGDELTALGVKASDVLLAKPEFYQNPQECYLCPINEYHCLPYIEYHVADNCNLNCRACVHFAPLAEGSRFADYRQVEKDLKRLHEIAPYIEEIHILGGEPLLNRELHKYLDLTRQIYPYAAIAIVTNGLLLKNVEPSLIESVKKNDICIWISLYPPMFKTVGKIVEKLRLSDISVKVSAPIKEFSYTFDENGGHLNGVKKINCTCPNLYQGKLAICPPVAYMEYFNNEFKRNINVENGKIDIYDKTLTFENLVEKLHTPIDICDRCLFVSKEDAVTLEWSQTKDKCYYDYVVKRHG